MVCNSKSNFLDANFNTHSVSKHETDKVNILQREKQGRKPKAEELGGRFSNSLLQCLKNKMLKTEDHLEIKFTAFTDGGKLVTKRADSLIWFVSGWT